MTTATARPPLINVTGQYWERRAKALLERRHMTVITANYQCRFGEVDLIALDQATLIFVEVKYRASSRFGPAALTVTRQKQARIVRAAALFLSTHPDYCHYRCRFDIIAFDQQGEAIQTTWLKAAFGANG